MEEISGICGLDICEKKAKYITDLKEEGIVPGIYLKSTISLCSKKHYREARKRLRECHKKHNNIIYFKNLRKIKKVRGSEIK